MRPELNLESVTNITSVSYVYLYHIAQFLMGEYIDGCTSLRNLTGKY